MKALLINLKKTKIWFIFLKFIFLPIYNFIWVYLINFEGKILSYKIRKDKSNSSNDLDLINNDKKIIRKNLEFNKLANLINSHLTENFLSEMRFKMQNTKHSEKSFLYNKPSYIIDMLPYVDLKLKKEIVNFALNNYNLSLVTKYLKVLPVIAKIKLNLNVPISGSTERGPMLWHKDDFGFKSLDLFLPIKKLSEKNGPLFFVENKNELGVFHKFTNVKKNPKHGERNKIEIESFNKATDEKINNFQGDPGDGLFIDSFSCYHRGGFCKEEERIMLRISYQTPDSIDVINKDHSKGFKFCESLNKEDRNLNKIDRYILFKRSKIFNFFNIPNFLIKIYRFFHFKDEGLI